MLAHKVSTTHYQHKYLFIYFNCLYIGYLHIDHLLPKIIRHPDMYFMPSGKRVWGSVTRDPVKMFCGGTLRAGAREGEDAGEGCSHE